MWKRIGKIRSENLFDPALLEIRGKFTKNANISRHLLKVGWEF